jgi:hypothetical protein
MKYDAVAALAQLEQDKEDARRAIFDLIDHNELLDDDGYPTEAALDVVKLWHWTDAQGWFKFIRSLWAYRDWGWTEGTDIDDWDDSQAYRYHISTAGWSGNESIIRAMQDNHMMWHLNWVQSRRGGHYIFEIREFDMNNRTPRFPNDPADYDLPPHTD